MSVCKELTEALEHEDVFFNVSGGCGVDLSHGESNCMLDTGVWFKFCPFCGKRIENRYTGNYWEWWEKDDNDEEEIQPDGGKPY